MKAHRLIGARSGAATDGQAERGKGSRRGPNPHRPSARAASGGSARPLDQAPINAMLARQLGNRGARRKVLGGGNGATSTRSRTMPRRRSSRRRKRIRAPACLRKSGGAAGWQGRASSACRADQPSSHRRRRRARVRQEAAAGGRFKRKSAFSPVPRAPTRTADLSRSPRGYSASQAG